jgi:hypothetical protein
LGGINCLVNNAPQRQHPVAVLCGPMRRPIHGGPRWGDSGQSDVGPRFLGRG